MSKEFSPPGLLLKFFRWYCNPGMQDYIEGDLLEEYQRRVRSKGKRSADLRFLVDVLLLCRPGIIRTGQRFNTVTPYDMYKSYLKITFRNVLRNKTFSFINISGLAIGMATCVLIMMYVADENSYDKHHADGDRIYRIASEVKNEKWVAAPAPMAEALKKDYPEVEQVTRLLRFPGTEKMLLRDEARTKQVFESRAYYVDSTFFQLFSYDLIYGDPRTALNEPNSIVVSEAVAIKFFGHENPVGQVLQIGLSFGEFKYTVTGVFNDTRNKSHIPANLLLSMNNGDVGGWVKAQTRWASNAIFYTYVKLSVGSDVRAFEHKLATLLDRHAGKEFTEAGYTKLLFLQPLKSIYLNSDFGYEIAPNGNIQYVYIFTSIAFFLLVIACINFMNLSTARSEKRMKEVGIRKVSGAKRGILVSQFLSESLILCILALVVTLVLIHLAMPGFNQLTGKNLSLLHIPNVYAWLIGLTIITGLCAGLYPAFYLSSFKPAAVLKGKVMNTLSAITIRRGLVVFQFTISIVLILGAIIIGQQMSFMANQNLGFTKNQKIVLPIQTSEANENFNVLRGELLNNAQVLQVARGGTYPGIETITSMLFYAEGKSSLDNVELQTAYAEDGYIEALGIRLVAGRGFLKDFANDTDALVLNETAVKKLGYLTETAVGRKVHYEFQGQRQTMTIIGVVKDYNFKSLHQKIQPLALSVAPIFSGPTSFLIADVRSAEYATIVSVFRATWDKINPASPFEYSLLEDDFQKNYEKDERTAKLIRYSMVLAVMIAGLGLFGLAAFTSAQRVKEIGVRKVLGASALQITLLLSKDFTKLVLIGVALAAPIGYYIMTKWLQGFAYRVEVKGWVFALAGIVALLIALFTVSFQAIRASRANPVKSLRSE